jgi:hypothetical protein
MILSDVRTRTLGVVCEACGRRGRDNAEKGCMLIEGFPAGQLRQWGQSHFGYNGLAGGAVARRTSLLDWMQGERGLHLSADDRCLCISSADALDAVICMYAAVAVRE